MGIPVFTVKEQTMPDPDFSTVSAPNPENEDALRLAIKLAKETGSGVVIGTDPDSDRMGIALKGNDGGYFLLTGNQIGALLLDYICRRKKETNTLPANAAAVKTIVTTSLAARIAESYGVEIFDVLTGFKFIGEKIKEWEADGSHTFVFGYEESFGYLSGTHSRDKDAVVASMLFAEMTAYYLDKRSSVQERLQELYEEFGYFYEKNVATTYKGLDGMERMASIMANLSERKITLPKSNVLYYGLSGGDWVCVRPSGTEPKLKVYVSTSGESASASEEKGKACLQFMSALL
jgi:phosphoglucomutase